MIGFLTGAIFRGLSVSAAEKQLTPNGKTLITWTIGVGGNRSRGIRGMFVTCKVWGEENADSVLDAVSDKGLAVIADGLPEERPKMSGEKAYANVAVNVYRLHVQLKKTDTELTEIPLLRPAKSGAEPEPVGAGKKK